MAERLGKRVHIVVPDEGEYNRSYRMCAPAPGVTVTFDNGSCLWAGYTSRAAAIASCTFASTKASELLLYAAQRSTCRQH